jgi:hypothetical protein
VDVALDVIVAAPLIVAALVSGNDPVVVINAVDEHARFKPDGVDQVHDIVPVHERGHDQGAVTATARTTIKRQGLRTLPTSLKLVL